MGEEGEPLLALASRVARQVLEQRGWQLIEAAAEAAFVAQVMDRVRAWQPATRLSLPQLIERAAINTYCERWYAACRAPETAEQTQAWNELSRHVQRLARKLDDSAETDDLALDILARIWTRLGQVKDPGSFLGWVNQVALHWIRDVQRQASQEAAVVEWDDAEVEQQAAPPDQPPPGEGDQPAEREALEAMLRRCLRSPDQQQVISRRFLDNRSVKQVADELGKQPGHVRTLTHRALAHLRECADLLAQLQRYQQRPHDHPDLPTEAGRRLTRHLKEAAGVYVTCADYQAWLPTYLHAELTGLAVPHLYPALNTAFGLVPQLRAGIWDVVGADGRPARAARRRPGPADRCRSVVSASAPAAVIRAHIAAKRAPTAPQPT